MTTETKTLRECCEEVWEDRVEREIEILIDKISLGFENEIFSGDKIASYLTILAYKEICWQFMHIIWDAKFVVDKYHGEDTYSLEQIINVMCAIAKDRHGECLATEVSVAKYIEQIQRKLGPK